MPCFPLLSPLPCGARNFTGAMAVLSPMLPCPRTLLAPPLWWIRRAPPVPYLSLPQTLTLEGAPLSAAHAVTVDAPCRHLRPPGAELMLPSPPPRRTLPPGAQNRTGRPPPASMPPFLPRLRPSRRGPSHRRPTSPCFFDPGMSSLVSRHTSSAP